MLCDKPLATKVDDAVWVQIEVSPGRALPGGWRTDAAPAGAGVMNNLDVHAYDLRRYLLDAEVVEATAVVDVGPGFAVDTMALTLLRCDTSALAYVNANQSVPYGQPNLSIYGTEGTVLGRNVTRPNLTGSISVLGGSGCTERQVSTAGAFAVTVARFADGSCAGTVPRPANPGAPAAAGPVRRRCCQSRPPRG